MRVAMLVVALTVAVGMLIPALVQGADVAKGQAIYQKSCVKCHGATGKGDGPMGSRLKPKLKDFSDQSYNASLKDDYLAKILTEGGKALGKSPTMPKLSNASEKDVADVIAFLRSLAK